MASPFRPSGIFVPLVTPFDEDGIVDLGSLEALAAEVIADGAAGVVALATTGEPHSLDADERAAVVAACARVCQEHDATLIVGAGTNDTRTTIERHGALADVPGVKASLTVVPYYVRPSEAAIVTHFEAVASRSPVPVIAYNIPARTGRGLGAKSLIELSEIDNIAGLKQSVEGLDLDTLTVLAASAERWSVLGGEDPFLFPLVLMGGAGAISASAHLCTSRFAGMIDDGLAGRLAEGRVSSAALLPVCTALFAEPSPAVIKAVLYAKGRIPTPKVRMPLSEASPQATKVALEAVSAAGG